MPQQTFIIYTWCGAPTYVDAQVNNQPTDFYRVSVKRLQTALKYLANWRRQSIEDYHKASYLKDLWDDNAMYEIVATPNGYEGNEVVAKGFTKDIKF